MVQTGLQILIAQQMDRLAGRRIGLVSHAAAVLPDLTGILPALLAAGARVEALFGPEHGFAGAALEGETVGHARHRRSGLPVYSLYGAASQPSAEMLAGLDLLLVDFQDVGVRFYTYLSTLYYVLRGAAQAGLPVLLLDRPNPLGGQVVDGPLLWASYQSFVGMLPIPLRYGLTLGELAGWMNTTQRLGAALEVVALHGWRRALVFEQTGLPWTPTSPAMPRLSTAALYPGMCLLEGTNLSEGRGTALPFEVAGAPWLDGEDLADTLNRLELPGVRFRPHSFLPTAGKHAGLVCQGVQVHIVERAALDPLALGLHVLAACRAANPAAFAFLPPAGGSLHPHIDLLYGSAAAREHLLAGRPVRDLQTAWAADCAGFRRDCQPYLLYD